jgi:hypothetical protein
MQQRWFRHAAGLLALTLSSASAADAPPKPEMGTLALGLLLGAVFGWAFAKTKGSLKAAISVAGAMLGAAPLMFLRGVGNARWAYTIGLLLAFLLSVFISFGMSKKVFEGGTLITLRTMVLSSIFVLIALTIAIGVYSVL